MPWCEECAKYWTPNAVGEDGRCPRCGDALLEPEVRRGAGHGAPATHVPGQVAADEKAPWHFKLLIAATAGYLVWRFVQIFS